MSEIKPWREYIGKHDAYIIMCDVLDALCEKEAIKKTVYERLKQAPSVYKWIPCSERLPGEHDPYEVLCCDVRGEQIIAHIYESDESNTGYSAESDDTFMVDCIAWMPLPEPYKRGDTND